MHVVRGCGVSRAPGPVVPSLPFAPLSLQGDVSSRCPEWIDKSGSERRKRERIVSVTQFPDDRSGKLRFFGREGEHSAGLLASLFVSM